MLKTYFGVLPLWRRQVRGGARSHSEFVSLQLFNLSQNALLARSCQTRRLSALVG